MVSIDLSVFWRPPTRGVEVLHAHFRQHRYSRHSHEGITVALMDSGTAVFDYRGESHVATAGDVFLINSNEVHTGWPVGPDGYRYRVLYLTTQSPGQFLRQEQGGGPPLMFRDTLVHDPALADLLDRTHRALAFGNQQLCQEELLVSTVTLLRERYAESERRAPRFPTIGGSGHHAVSIAREYLDSHVTEKVSLSDLASAARIGPHQLVRKFTAEIGMPPHAYQNQLRVRLAASLLAGDMPLAGIAPTVGFYDQAHLSRVFKSHTGVTPHQFRLGARTTADPPSPKIIELFGG